MHKSAMKYGQDFFSNYCLGDFSGKAIVDVGSQDVNGSLRVFCPIGAHYIGVDFVEGKGVDVVLEDPYKLPFADEAIDVVVCSSVFEHSEFFWLLYLECIRILKPSGLLYINVPSNGKIHRYPIDGWRFYPDAGLALVNWAKYNNYNSELLESFLGEKIGPIEGEGLWNDFVAVIVKDKSYESLYPLRIQKNTHEISPRYSSENIDSGFLDINNPDYNLILKQNEIISSLRTVLAGREAEVSNIYNSISWKITKPLRELDTLIRRLSFNSPLMVKAINRSGALIKKLIKAVAGKAERCMSNFISLPKLCEYKNWVEEYDTLSDEAVSALRGTFEKLPQKPLISILMPTYNSNPVWLKEAIESVRNQIYTNWELIIFFKEPIAESTRELCNKYVKFDSRVKLFDLNEDRHSSGDSNKVFGQLVGEWVVMMDYQYLLSSDSLFHLVKTINENDGVKFIYSDEDAIDQFGNRCLPQFKPDWSPHLMAVQYYLGGVFAFKLSPDTWLSDGVLIKKCVGEIAYSLTSTLEDNQIYHLSKVLFHQNYSLFSRESRKSESVGLVYLESVKDFIAKRYPSLQIDVRCNELDESRLRIEHKVPDDTLVSIIIPTKDKVDLLSNCVNSIIFNSIWQNFEIIVLDNNSVEQSTFDYFEKIQLQDSRVKVINAAIEFNWSKLNNLGFEHSHGDVIVFLNNDTLVISEDWLESLVGYALMPDVGLVGGLLLYDDNSIQHSGVVVGMNGWADHIYKGFMIGEAVKNFIDPTITRNVLALTGACMAISREKFIRVGKFDENFIICGSDVEICIRAHKLGFFNVMASDAKLYHFESKTRTSFVPDVDYQQSSLKYKPYREEICDPFFNENLSLKSTNPDLRDSND